MTYPFDLGSYSRPVSSNAEAQIWFDRAMVWLFGYNHEEALVCFQNCLDRDPTVALAHWGIAYAIGPNYNKPWEVFSDEEKAPALETAHAALKSGQSLAAADTLESALLTALEQRYPTDPAIVDFKPFNNAFANAMRPIHDAHGEDLDVVFIFAESLMNRTPWQLWDFWTGVPNPKGSALEAQSALDRVFQSRADAWDHPGLLHMYIHLMEMSPHPERALRHGDRLTDLVPDSGHLSHMATHIDVLCGDYQNVVTRNLVAEQADIKFKAHAGAANFYALYRIHDIHFALYGAMFLAQKQVALDAADRLRLEVPDEVVRVYPDLFEAFVASKPHVLIRFGLWEDILAEEIPQDRTLYAVTHALFLYARAVALANLGRFDEANKEAAEFDDAYAAIPDERKLFQNKARDVLAIAQAMMRGEIAFKSGDRATGLEFLRDAVAKDDALLYEEPWAWPQPTRHALGALLMEDGLYEEAEAVYRADLGLDASLPRPCQHPRNIWALHGLHECLERRGEQVERIHVAQQLTQAQARADHTIHASCACRSSAA